MSKKVKVIIGLPTMGHVHTLTMVVIVRWIADALLNRDKGLSVYPTMGVRPVDNARNEIVETFLSDPEATHLLFVDADTVPPMDSLDKLLAHDLPIVSAITPIIEYDKDRKNDSGGFYKKWNCVGMDEKFVEPNTGLVPIKGAGSSLILIKREVFEKMPKPWYRWLHEDDRGKEVEVGEDIHFIIKSLALGFKPMADTNIIAQHEKSILW